MKAAVFSFFGGAMPIARRLFSRKVVLAAALVLQIGRAHV